MARARKTATPAAPVLETDVVETPALETAPAPALDLSTLGEFGMGSNAETAACPHCGINHTDNGMLRADDFAPNSNFTLHQLGLQHAEFSCMGCNGEWGPVREPYVVPESKARGKGLRIQKDRVERNGIKQPSLGGACRSVWDACTEMQALDPTKPLAVKQVKEHAVTMGWNANNAVIEFYRWKKWSAPTPAELEAVAPATEVPAQA